MTVKVKDEVDKVMRLYNSKAVESGQFWVMVSTCHRTAFDGL